MRIDAIANILSHDYKIKSLRKVESKNCQPLRIKKADGVGNKIDYKA